MTVIKTSGRRAAVGVGIMFSSNGAIFAALLPWYPLVADRLSLGPVEFGFIVASFAAGSIISSALPAPLIARFGPVKVSIIGTGLLAASVMSAPWAGVGWVFALCLFCAGFFDAIVDVAQNVAGIRVQDAVGRSILSSMHALWSLGGVAGGALSTAAAAGGIDMRVALAVVGIIGIALVSTGALMTRPLADNAPLPPATTEDGGTAAPRRGRVLLLALPLIIVAICGTMVEDIANNWAALSAVEVGGLSAGVAGLAFTTVIGSQCIGRFSGDLMIQRWGAAAVGRLGSILIAAGGLILVTTVWPGQLFIGLALAGFGSATLVPSAFSAAARLPGISEGAGVTIVSWLMRIGFLVTSPLVGAITDNAGLRCALGLFIIIGTAAALLAGALSGRRARADGPERADIGETR